MFPSSASSSPARQAEDFIHHLHRVRGMAGSPAIPQGTKETLAFSPPCRLRLEGGEAQESSCEILELSAEGVNIVINGRAVHEGQHGRLLIGPPEGDHYELPVDVSWVKPAHSASVLGLSLPTPPSWRFSRS